MRDIEERGKIICARDPRQQNKESSYFSFSSRDARVIFLKIYEIFMKNSWFWTFFQLCYHRSLQRSAGPARYYAPTTGTRRAVHPPGTGRSPAHRAEDYELIINFWYGLKGSAFTIRHTKRGQLEGAAGKFFSMFFIVFFVYFYVFRVQKASETPSARHDCRRATFKMFFDVENTFQRRPTTK